MALTDIGMLPFLIALIAVFASAWGMGKTDANKNSPEYQSAVAFAVIGLCFVMFVWYQKLATKM